MDSEDDKLSIFYSLGTVVNTTSEQANISGVSNFLSNADEK